MTDAVRNFWLELKLSAFNLGYYRHLRRAPVGGGVRYFLLLHAILAVLMTATFLPALVGLPVQARQFFTDKVPADAYFEIKNGRLTTNLPDGWIAAEGDYTFVVSTLAGTTAPTRSETNWVVIGQDAVFTMDETAGARLSPLKNYPDVRYNRDQILTWIDGSLPWWLVLAAVIALVVVWGWLALMNAAGVMLLSWLAASYTGIIGLRLTHAHWQNMGWRLATTPALVSLALMIAGVRLPFTFTVVFLMFVMAVTTDEKADPAVSQ